MLHDDLYVLACAVDDADRDLGAAGARPTVRELTEILRWVLDAGARCATENSPHPRPNAEFRHDVNPPRFCLRQTALRCLWRRQFAGELLGFRAALR